MKMNDSLILAVDAGGSFLKAALAGENGTLLPDTFMRIPVDSNGTAGEISASYRALARLAKETAARYHAVVSAAAVCIPGPFHYQDGICLMTHKYAGIYGLPMRPWFWEELGDIPILFLHDSSAFLLGALSDEDRRRFTRICGTMIGTGLGFASMFEGKIFQNPQGGPGISIFSRPFRDSTAEEYASRRAVENSYRRLCPDGPVLQVVEIAQLAREGKPQARQAFQELGACLGEILRPICAEHAFQLLLLGGAISKSADLFLPALSAAMGDVLPVIRPTKDIDNAPLAGAVRAAMQRND